MFGGYSLMFNQHLKQNVDCTGTFDERYRNIRRTVQTRFHFINDSVISDKKTFIHFPI